jgi:hypothetical protein
MLCMYIIKRKMSFYKQLLMGLGCKGRPRADQHQQTTQTFPPLSSMNDLLHQQIAYVAV